MQKSNPGMEKTQPAMKKIQSRSISLRDCAETARWKLYPPRTKLQQFLNIGRLYPTRLPNGGNVKHNLPNGWFTMEYVNKSKMVDDGGDVMCQAFPTHLN